MRPRRRLTDAEQRRLVLAEGELTALANHPSWPTLEAAISDRITKFEREITVAIFGGRTLDVERQAFIRGFVKGMQYVLAVPSGAETSLAAYLKSQEEVAS